MCLFSMPAMPTMPPAPPAPPAPPVAPTEADPAVKAARDGAPRRGRDCRAIAAPSRHRRLACRARRRPRPRSRRCWVNKNFNASGIYLLATGQVTRIMRPMPMRRSFVAVVILGVGVAALCVVVGVVVRGLPLEPPTPPILHKASAGGGWSSACPPENDTEARFRDKTGKLAISPEFDARLMRDFPAGTTEATLIEALTSQGFIVLGPCRSEPAIRMASFRQHGGGLYVYPMMATAYWKVDEVNVVEWTRGFVSFHGL